MLAHERERAYKEAYLAAINGYLANPGAERGIATETAINAHKVVDALARKYIASLEKMQKESSPL